MVTPWIGIVHQIPVRTLQLNQFMTVKKSFQKTRKLRTIKDPSDHDGLFNSFLNAILGIKDFVVKQLVIPGFIHGNGSYIDICEKVDLTPTNLINELKRMMRRVENNGF